jgi:hypothetical protein
MANNNSDINRIAKYGLQQVIGPRAMVIAGRSVPIPSLDPGKRLERPPGASTPVGVSDTHDRTSTTRSDGQDPPTR